MKRYNGHWKSLLVLLVISLGLSDASLGEGGPIRIGFVGDFSSVSKAYTDNAYKAAQQAVADFNAEGGVIGRPVELIRRDGGNDPDLHYRHFTELVRNEGVVAVFGGAASPNVLKASAASRELKVPYLVSIGNSQSIVVENGHPFVFMFEPNSRMESLGFSIFATLMPWKRYAWIGPDYAWGRDVLGFFKQYFDDIDAPIEWATEVWHPLGATEYTDAIKRIIESRPDALVVATWGEDLRHFMRAAEAVKLFDNMAAFGWFSTFSGAEERIFPEGIWKISRGPFNYLATKYPQTRAFVEKFHDLYDTYPLGFTIACYDSLLAWQRAVTESSSAEPAKVAEILKGMRFTGLRGESYIRAIDGQMNSPAYFGRLIYNSDYPIGVIDPVIEIPADNIWLTEKEVESRRSLQDTKSSNN